MQICSASLNLLVYSFASLIRVSSRSNPCATVFSRVARAVHAVIRSELELETDAGASDSSAPKPKPVAGAVAAAEKATAGKSDAAAPVPIVLAGFSQGGALALYAALTAPPPLSQHIVACCAHSAYLPLHKQLLRRAQLYPPPPSPSPPAPSTPPTCGDNANRPTPPALLSTSPSEDALKRACSVREILRLCALDPNSLMCDALKAEAVSC